jgi:hypothetical protein
MAGISFEKIIEVARQRNPKRRLTQPGDVARYIAALCHPDKPIGSLAIRCM